MKKLLVLAEIESLSQKPILYHRALARNSDGKLILLTIDQAHIGKINQFAEQYIIPFDFSNPDCDLEVMRYSHKRNKKSGIYRLKNGQEVLIIPVDEENVIPVYAPVKNIKLTLKNFLKNRIFLNGVSNEFKPKGTFANPIDLPNEILDRIITLEGKRVIHLPPEYNGLIIENFLWGNLTVGAIKLLRLVINYMLKNNIATKDELLNIFKNLENYRKNNPNNSYENEILIVVPYEKISESFLLALKLKYPMVAKKLAPTGVNIVRISYRNEAECFASYEILKREIKEGCVKISYEKELLKVQQWAIEKLKANKILP